MKVSLLLMVLIKKLLRKKPRFVLIFTEKDVSLFFYSPSSQPTLMHVTRVLLEMPPAPLFSFLNEAPLVPVDIFHDTPDQLLKVEKIPPNLQGFDTHRWVRHKRRNLREEAPFSGIFRYRYKSRDVLFASFQIHALLLPWLALLEKCTNPLENVYVFALEQVSAYHNLHQHLTKTPTPWLLCAHFEKNDRVRHTVLHEGRFILSRLFPPLTSLPNVALNEENRVREIQGTLRYLMKQFAISSRDIQALFLGENLQSEGFFPLFEQGFWVLSPQKSAEFLTISPRPADFERVFLTWFYQGGPKPLLRLKSSSNAQKRFAWSFQRSHWVWFCLFGLILGVGSVVFLIQGHYLQQKISFFQQQAKQLKIQQDQVHQALAAWPLSADQTRHILALQQDLNGTSSPPLKIIEKLVPALGEKIRLRHLDWQRGGAEGLTNVLTIEAYPTSTALSQKQLVRLFDAFLERLKAHFPQSVLDILHGPYTTYQTQLLTGGLNDADLMVEPTCIVKISW